MAETKLTAWEQEKAVIITAAIDGTITNGQAARQLRLSIRQVKRMKAAVRKSGTTAVVHQLKGKPSNHRYDESDKETLLKTIKDKYSDFTPKFATEKLQEIDGIAVTSQTIRVWMTEVGLWKPRKQKHTTYRSWRPRKEYYGELQQFDGSYHLWFENRFVDENGNPIEVCLLAAIDDASGKITKAVFAANEGIVAVFTFWKEYLEKHGKPLGIYLDKFSTYKINHKKAVDNFELMTQFQRVLQTLSIERVIANSPEAKGRVERLFQTLQDRLVKEMRLFKINTPEDGNKFLKEVFIPKFNEKFAVTPAKDGDVHRPIQTVEKKKLNHLFSIHEIRRVNNDFTIQFKNNWYQLTEIQPTTVRPKEHVIMETWLDNSVHVILRDRELNYFLLLEKPQKRLAQPAILTSHPLMYKPPPDHPWRHFKLKKG
jgi:transposase